MKERLKWPVSSEMGELLGKTLVSIKKHDDFGDHGVSVTFATSEGDEYVMQHHQDCCESVWLEDVVGEFDDLLGSPLLVSEEVSSAEPPPAEYTRSDSYTWTYYNMATIKGSVQFRWFGTSNGYYSERAELYRLTK